MCFRQVSARRLSTEAVRLQDVTREQRTARDESTGLRVPPAGNHRRLSSYVGDEPNPIYASNFINHV